MSGFASALDKDVSLKTKVNAVWDEAETGAPYPYIAMGNSSVSDMSGKTESLSEHDFKIHVWSNAKGRMETKEIMTLVHSALHLRTLTLSSQKLIYLRFVSAEDNRETSSNSVIYHGRMSFKGLIGTV